MRCRSTVIVCSIVLAGCSGSSPEQSTSQNDVVPSVTADGDADNDALLNTFGAELQDQLKEDLGLSDEETDCVTERVLVGWTELSELMQRPEEMAAQVVERVEAAEAVCFTAERQEELASASASSPTSESSSAATDASEQAFLAAAESVEGVTGDADALLEAGQTVCVVARDLHTLESLLATLTVDAVAAASLGAELAPLVGSVLTADQLAAFSIMSVVSLCPELDDI